MGEYDDRRRDGGGTAGRVRPARHAAVSPGKQTLVQRRYGGSGGRRTPGKSTLAGEQRAGQSPGDIAQRGTQGAGSPLPHLDRIQRSFGAHDVSGVQAHVGDAAADASAALGAEAYATGDSIAFASTPSLHTAAHEAAHVVQQRGGVQLRGGIGQVGDAHEQHADAVADRVVSGRSAEDLLDQRAPRSAASLLGAPHASNAGASAAIQRRETPHGNPLEQSAHGHATTTHAEPKLGDGYGDHPQRSNGTGWCEAMNVAILAGEANPLRISGTPAETQLFLRLASGGVHVEQRLGTPHDPYIKQAIAADTIFIGGRPTGQDIEQGEIGDCYFLAAVHQVLTRDPSKIPSMMAVSGHSVTVTFFRYDSSTNHHVATPITVNRELVQNVDAHGGATGLHGAGFRVAPAPARSEWYAKMHGDMLGVIRKDFYETAMWAPLLEKAYAQFAQRYGQYGGFRAPDVTPNATRTGGHQRSGYDIIDGGLENDVYGIFFGDAVQSHREAAMNYAPGTNPVAANMSAVRRLLQLQGHGLPARQQIMMTVSADNGPMLDRASALCDVALSDPVVAHYPAALRGDLRYMKALVRTYRTLTTAGRQNAAVNHIARVAYRIVKPSSWPIINRDSAPPSIKNLLEVLDDVANAGTSGDRGQRFAYTEHAYSVMSVTFRDARGAELHLDPARLAAQIPNIDAAQSQVVLRNPHRTNEPDVHGRGHPDDGSLDDGVFTINLDQFFRNYSNMDFAMVRTS